MLVIEVEKLFTKTPILASFKLRVPIPRFRTQGRIHHNHNHCRSNETRIKNPSFSLNIIIVHLKNINYLNLFCFIEMKKKLFQHQFESLIFMIKKALDSKRTPTTLHLSKAQLNHPLPKIPVKMLGAPIRNMTVNILSPYPRSMLMVAQTAQIEPTLKGGMEVMVRGPNEIWPGL